MKNLLDFSKWVSTKEINKGIEDILDSLPPNQKHPGDYVFNKLGGLIPLDMEPNDSQDFFRTIAPIGGKKMRKRGIPANYSDDHLAPMRFKDSYWKHI